MVESNFIKNQIEVFKYEASLLATQIIELARNNQDYIQVKKEYDEIWRAITKLSEPNKVNFNQYCNVDLTDYGVQLYYQYKAANGLLELNNGPDNKGLYKFQLWHFMQIFGSFMSPGFKPVIESFNVTVEDIL